MLFSIVTLLALSNVIFRCNLISGNSKEIDLTTKEKTAIATLSSKLVGEITFIRDKHPLTDKNLLELIKTLPHNCRYISCTDIYQNAIAITTCTQDKEKEDIYLL